MSDKNDLLAVLQLLKKYNLKNTEELLKREANLTDDDVAASTDGDVNRVLAAYKSEGDPEQFETSYIDLKKFVESALDIYKHELAMILYPVLVHLYLRLIYNGHNDAAKKFLDKFGPEQETYYQEDLTKLKSIMTKEHMENNDFAQTFKENEFSIRISRDTLSLLKRHLQDKKYATLLAIVNDRLCFDMYEGVARTKQQIDSTSGAHMGEAKREDNKIKVYYGLLKEPDVQTIKTADEEEEDAEGDGIDKPKKKKAKKDPLFSKKTKSDPNAPPMDRMPLPDYFYCRRDTDKVEKLRALREASKRVTLGAESLPTVCFYTLLNSVHQVTAAEVAEDSSLLAVGFSDSHIKVWALTPTKLRSMKSSEQLQDVDREADDVLVRMMDDRTAETYRSLYGHSGPVYRIAFNPDRNLLLSCSEDGMIRLWSLHTWTCVVCYKGHIYPVWDVRFSPYGYYFATASHDKTARLWATDSHTALRIFSGHLSDVDVVQFHPNINYIATGSSDRTVRLWDCVSGNHVRLMTGHKSAVYSLCFSVCGRYLASGSSDHRILLWDIANGFLVASLVSHTGPVHSLAFSRDGNILASGSLDSTLKLWDFTKLCEEVSNKDMNVAHNPDVKTGDSFLLRSYPTKNSPIVCLHFSRRNLLKAVGMYDAS